MGITTSTTYGRQDILWPDFAHEGGSALHGKIVSAIGQVSNNLTGLWSGEHTLANGASYTFTHNFGMALTELTVAIYVSNAFVQEGSSATWTLAQVNTDSFTITNNTGGSATFFAYCLGFNLDKIIGDASATSSGLVTALAQTFAGLKTFGDGIATDTIAEETLNAGVTVDGMLIKDGKTAAGNVAPSTAAFDKELSASEDTTQKALDRLDEYDSVQEWAASKDYRLANIVIANGGLYRCISAHTSTSTFDSTKWEFIGAASSLSQIAGVEPTLDLIFDSMAAFNNVDFVRATQASYYDKDGYLKLAASGVPRIDYDPSTTELKGALIEEARTNLFTATENFENSVWLKNRASIASNVEVAPDGSYTADKIVMDTQSGAHYIYANNVGISSSTTYAASVYLKKGEVTWARVELGDGAGAVIYRTYVNLSTGAFGTPQSVGTPTSTARKIEDVGNGWYRVSVIANIGAYTTADFTCYLAEGDLDTSFAVNDGKSGLYIWGAQLEAGAFPTSYIPSTDAWSSRTGTATWYDANGVLQTAATLTARTTYNPDPARLYLAPKLLVEPAATNSFLQSANFAVSWSTSCLTVSGNTTATPDGDTTSKNILFTNNGSIGGTYAYQAYSTTSGTPYCMSVYFKVGTYASNVYLQDFTEAGQLTYSQTTGLLSVSGICEFGGIQALPNGWFRLWGVFRPTTTSSHTVAPCSFDDQVGGKTMYFWGAQIEEGYGPTSYIATTSGTATRNADSYTTVSATRNRDDASMTGANFTSWYRQDEGTIYSESDTAISSSSPAFYGYVYAISDGTNNNNIYSANWAGENRLLVVAKSATTQCAVISATNPIARTKLAGAFAVNNFAAYSSAGTSGTDSSGSVPSVNKLSIGSNSENTDYKLNGHVRRLAFFPERLSNAKLQAMTSVVPYSTIPSASMDRAGLMPAGVLDLVPGGRPFKDFRLVISSGAIKVTGTYHTLIGEATAGVPAADDLVTINGGVDGQLLVLRAYDDAVTITVRTSTSTPASTNIQLSADMALDNAYDTLTLMYSASLAKWLEIARSNNGA